MNSIQLHPGVVVPYRPFHLMHYLWAVGGLSGAEPAGLELEQVCFRLLSR